MQDLAFVRAVFNAIPESHSYLEVVSHGGSFLIQPEKLLVPGEGDTISPHWKSMLRNRDEAHYGSSGCDCFIIEGREVDLDDKQDPFYLKARAAIDASQVTAVVEKWIG